MKRKSNRADRQIPLSETEMQDLESDNRKRQFALIAGLIFFVSIAIIILSIVANDNFGDDREESFELQDPSTLKVQGSLDPEAEAGEPRFNANGYSIVQKCSFPRYFTQGLEVLQDQKTLLMSSGRRRSSKLALLEMDLSTCTFTEVFAHENQDRYFAEGATVYDNSRIF